MQNSESRELVCVAEFLALEGKTQELVTALHALMKPTHKEPGCLRYELNRRSDDSRWISFIEKWKNRETFDRHCAMPYIKQFFDDVRPHLVEQFEVKLYEEILP
jgi:quinol monooxygenase YgiN